MTKPDDSFVAHVLDQLAPLGATGRRMFGGTGLYADGVMFGIAFRGELYFKVDDASVGAYDALGAHPFQPDDRWKTTTYRSVPAEILDDPSRLAEWAARAVRAAVAAGKR